MLTWSSEQLAQTLSTTPVDSNSWLIYLLPLCLLALLILFILQKTHWKRPKIPPTEVAAIRAENEKLAQKAEAHAHNSTHTEPVKVAVAHDVQDILADSETSWMARLRDGLSKTRTQLSSSLGQLFGSKKVFNDELLEELHENLYRSDMGVETADRMVSVLRKKFSGEASMPSWADVSRAMKDEVVSIFGGAPAPLNYPASGPMVILVVGVNGVGKTTSIGKLTARFVSEGKSVLLCAGDTFRAAAIEQLSVWGDRLNVTVIKHQQGADPASVAFDGVKAAKARGVDILLIDTAGRLHSKAELMDELAKIKRVIQKELPEAPHETWLVIDSTNGQNAVQQVKAFTELVQLSGLIVTKLDGTAKGGVIVGIHTKFHIPIRYIGVGEKAADLKEFIPSEYADSLFTS
ncbi:MAG: signal recognition particle-docking protein FtsY [Chitinophagaceae bacterium]|nr:signal recognition particle-docking protein FtsY [Oligoflexus sp.]